MPTVRIKAGHVQPLWAGHPWVFAQAIDRIEGNAQSGDEVRVEDPKGNFLGRGFLTPGSALAVRILTRDPNEALDEAFFRRRIEGALRLRQSLGIPSSETTGYRLVHAEGDGLPGLIVDKFEDVLAVQWLTAGMKRRQSVVLDALRATVAPKTILDRTPVGAAKKENFQSGSGPIFGPAVESLVFRERGFDYRIPMEIAQKTGFYFDQRDLRARVERLAKDRSVLDTFCFVGSFSLAAARGGARSVVAVDESAPALAAGEAIAAHHGLRDRIEYRQQDAGKVLQEAGASDGFDLVIVDPPRLSPTRSHRDSALQAYAKLAELGCRATRRGGFVVVCSCSAAIDTALLTRALALGATRANVQALVVERHSQGADHPVMASFPEGLYLKALLAQVVPR